MSWRGFKRHVVVLAVLLVSASVCGGALALDPKKAITQYVHDVWTTEDGLPQNSILSITQTRDGYLWLGTMQGLVRFDGVRFTVFESGNTGALKSNYIGLLQGDREGNLWIGTSRGLIRFKDGEFTPYRIRHDRPYNTVLSISEDREDGKFTSFTTKDGLSHDSVRSIYEDPEGSLWIGTDGGLNRLKDGKLTK